MIHNRNQLNLTGGTDSFLKLFRWASLSRSLSFYLCLPLSHSQFHFSLLISFSLYLFARSLSLSVPLFLSISLTFIYLFWSSSFYDYLVFSLFLPFSHSISLTTSLSLSLSRPISCSFSRFVLLSVLLYLSLFVCFSLSAAVFLSKTVFLSICRLTLPEWVRRVLAFKHNQNQLMGSKITWHLRSIYKSSKIINSYLLPIYIYILYNLLFYVRSSNFVVYSRSDNKPFGILIKTLNIRPLLRAVYEIILLYPLSTENIF